ncbi:MAG: mechanosensitive ion channel [Pirellulaceae bacterium]|nr:mechanosensitive ion channel [Pirellulaceae bacterium]
MGRQTLRAVEIRLRANCEFREPPRRGGLRHGTVRARTPFFACLALLAVFVGVSTTLADPPATSPAPNDRVTPETIDEQLKRIDAAEGMDDETKTTLQKSLQQALKDLETARHWAASAERFERDAATTPDDLAATRDELDALPREPAAIPADAGLTQLEQTLSDKTAKVAADKAQLAELDAEPKRRVDRRAKAPKLIVALRERLTDVERQLQGLASAANPSEVDSARRLALLAQRQAMEQEILSHEKELLAYEKRVEWLPLRRDLVARRIALGERETTLWRDAVNRRRHQEAEEQLRLAKQAEAEAHPAIAGLAERNAQLAERRKDVSLLIGETTVQLDQTDRQLATLREQFKRIEDRVEMVGRTKTIGSLLRKEREQIPDVRAHRQKLKHLHALIGQCQYERLELEDRRSALSNIDSEVRRHAQTASLRGDAAAELENAARRALETEKEYVDNLIVDLDRYHYKLLDLAAAEEQLTTQTAEFVKYIDERVLWIHSTAPLSLASLAHSVHAAAWLTDPEAWFQLGRSLWEDMKSQPIPGILAFLILAPLVWNQRRLRRKTTEIGTTAARTNCCGILPTVEALFLLVLLCAAVPAMLWYVSWRLLAAGSPADLAEAVAAGLTYSASIYLILDLVQQMCRRDGLAQSHFDWPEAALKPLRKYIQIAKVSVLPSVFIAVSMAARANNSLADSLGRFGFIAAMAFCSLLAQRAMRYHGPLYQAMLPVCHDGILNRLRLLWYPVAVLMPLVLAALAATGYYYTAFQLAGRLVASAYVLLGLVVVRSLLLRWILVNRRKLAIEQARQRRAAAQAEGKLTEETPTASDIPTPTEQTLDLATINFQTRRLVKYSLTVAGTIGFWVVWVDVLPALRIFDRITLWQSADHSRVTSLADAFLAILAFATAMVAARNLPALLELAVLQRSKLDPSLRYTVAAIMRYASIVIGLLVGCHFLGLRWGTVQWLVAAISVGLGFGLQEIFSNFVSGIIILFERPVRVGDVVTVDDITGVISRIRMRATTITNWDRKEFIVPNREFITGRLLNWTLSDQVNRITINVGIAYGSDTQLATEILTRIVREQPLILTEPPPRVTFEAFGQSSLDYVVRCFLPDMENRLAVIHDLHMSIDREFRAAGIEIAFPQQNIHIRSIPAEAGLLGMRSGPRPEPLPTPKLRAGDDDPPARSRQVA